MWTQNLWNETRGQGTGGSFLKVAHALLLLYWVNKILVETLFPWGSPQPSACPRVDHHWGSDNPEHWALAGAVCDFKEAFPFKWWPASPSGWNVVISIPAHWGGIYKFLERKDSNFPPLEQFFGITMEFNLHLNFHSCLYFFPPSCVLQGSIDLIFYPSPDFLDPPGVFSGCCPLLGQVQPYFSLWGPRRRCVPLCSPYHRVQRGWMFSAAGYSC